MNAEERVKKLHLKLPSPPVPAGLYHRVTVVGKRCVVSGHGPVRQKLNGDVDMVKGRVGEDLTVDDAKEAARLTGLAMLSSLRHSLGSLNRVKRLVRTFGLVNGHHMFEQHPTVIDGFSELMREVFGENGVGARSAVGAGTLPLNIPVEIEAEFELHDESVQKSKQDQELEHGHEHIYWRRFGLRSVINCIGNFTSLGGSRMSEKVTNAMAEAARHFVDLNALQRECGNRLAQMCRCPPDYGAFITTGAAAALALVTAACMAGDNEELIRQLPQTTPNSRQHVVMDGGNDLRWNQSIRTSGACIQLLGSASAPMRASDLEVELAGPRKGKHACIIVFDIGECADKLPLSEVLAIGHRHGVPVIVDAAARVPPRRNLWYFTHLGVDAVIFSGGKQLGGPQTSGLVLGRKDLIRCMALNGSPNEYTVCRPMKCSKEDMVGLVVAVESYLQGSDEDDFARYEDILSFVQSSLKGVRGISSLRRVCPSPSSIQPNTIPRLYIDLYPGPKFSHSIKQSLDGFYQNDVDHGNPLAIRPVSAAATLAHRLASGDPCVAVNTSDQGVIINPQLVSMSEARVVVQRVTSECTEMFERGELAAFGQAKL